MSMLTKNNGHGKKNSPGKRAQEDPGCMEKSDPPIVMPRLVNSAMAAKAGRKKGVV